MRTFSAFSSPITHAKNLLGDPGSCQTSTEPKPLEEKQYGKSTQHRSLGSVENSRGNFHASLSARNSLNNFPRKNRQVEKVGGGGEVNPHRYMAHATRQ